MSLDTVIKGGTVIDGTGGPGRMADLAIRDGRIAAIGVVSTSDATEVIDAAGLTVAPGVIDLHTHYDAQLHWDPYCTNSGSHGSTTVVIGNCGFGFAPCPPPLRDRYVQMMERTEQIPSSAVQAALPWTWETFPEWLAHLRALPKGINVGAYIPLNPLMIYVMGLDAAKTRAPNTDERTEMRRLLHEAMDHGAVGLAFSWLGPNNNHVDIDGTPMPTDVMSIDVAYDLATVLRERGAGVIQVSCDVPGPGFNDQREVAADLARLSGQTVIHNITAVVPGFDTHEKVLAWLDDCTDEGLDVYSQGVLNRGVVQFVMTAYTSWDILPSLRTFTTTKLEDKLALAADPDYRARVASEYDPGRHGGTAAALHEYMLASAEGYEQYGRFEGQLIRDIATALGKSTVDTFFDLLVDTRLEAEFTHLTRIVSDASVVGPVLRHPRVLAGASDGGAHIKMMSGGQFSTDFLTWLTRDGGQFTPEEMHAKLSALPAAVLRTSDRGTIAVGKAADLMIYDYDELGFTYGRYEKVHDLPDGGWRRLAPPRGIHRIIVNGRTTIVDGTPTGTTPGVLVS